MNVIHKMMLNRFQLRLIYQLNQKRIIIVDEEVLIMKRKSPSFIHLKNLHSFFLDPSLILISTFRYHIKKMNILYPHHLLQKPVEKLSNHHHHKYLNHLHQLHPNQFQLLLHQLFPSVLNLLLLHQLQFQSVLNHLRLHQNKNILNHHLRYKNQFPFQSLQKY
jgi:hypothetical protein